MFGTLQKVGAELTLKEDRHFSEKWMEKIEDVEVEEPETEEDVKPEAKAPKKNPAPKNKADKPLI